MVKNALPPAASRRAQGEAGHGATRAGWVIRHCGCCFHSILRKNPEGGLGVDGVCAYLHPYGLWSVANKSSGSRERLNIVVSPGWLAGHSGWSKVRFIFLQNQPLIDCTRQIESGQGNPRRESFSQFGRRVRYNPNSRLAAQRFSPPRGSNGMLILAFPSHGDPASNPIAGDPHPGG
jgi:hypothetical protein